VNLCLKLDIFSLWAVRVHVAPWMCAQFAYRRLQHAHPLTSDGLPFE
jgi:hypothetical protein